MATPPTAVKSERSATEKRSAVDREEQKAANQAARILLRQWLDESSGYDEATWPIAKQLIEDNRLSPRCRFGD